MSMPYDIQVVECDRQAAEQALKKQANQGWQLVSCWPEAEKVIAVFQRPLPHPAEMPPTQIAAAHVTAPDAPAAVRAETSAPTLDEVLALTIAAPTRSGTSRHVLSVAGLATSQSQTSPDMLAALHALGLTTDSKKHRGHRIWLYQGKSAWFVNAEPDSGSGSHVDSEIGL